MGNVSASTAKKTGKTEAKLAAGGAGDHATNEKTPTTPPDELSSSPLSFEEIHKKTKEVFPMNFEGAKLIVNKGLSSHFQINHTLTMSSLQPSGYKFGVTYVGAKQFSPVEAYPVLVGEVEPDGSLTAQIIHQFTANTRVKYVSQIHNGKWLGTQMCGELRGKDYTAACTLGNIDIVNGSGLVVTQYIQSVTKNLALGAELLYQRGPTMPGGHLGVFSLAGRYTAPKWQLSSNITPMAGALHACYHYAVTEGVQVGIELEGSLRNQECTTTIGYQIDVPNANVTFKGQVDTNWCVGATLEKKLLPLPFTFALSGFANHVKGTYRFGLGLILG